MLRCTATPAMPQRSPVETCAHSLAWSTETLTSPVLSLATENHAGGIETGVVTRRSVLGNGSLVVTCKYPRQTPGASAGQVTASPTRPSGSLDADRPPVSIRGRPVQTL